MHKRWQRKQEVVEPPGSLCWECGRGCRASDIQHNSRIGRKAASLCCTPAAPRTPGMQSQGKLSAPGQQAPISAELIAMYIISRSAQPQAPSPCVSWGTTMLAGDSPTATPLHTRMGPCLRDPVQPKVGSTRWSELGSCSTLLFKVGPPRATHITSLVKSQEANPRLSQPLLHSLPSTMETIQHQGKGEVEEQQQECWQLSISETSLDHRAQTRTRNGEKSKDGE